MSQRWVEWVIESCERMEEMVESTSRWSILSDDPQGLCADRGPARIIAAPGTEHSINSSARKKREITSIELPKGYYEERVKINRRKTA